MEDQELESGIVKKFIYVNRKAPHGTIYAHEALGSCFNRSSI